MTTETPFFVVATPRPSDPTEIVSIADSTDFDEGATNVADIITSLISFEAYLASRAEQGLGSHWTVAVTPEVLEQYIETPEAAARNHLWLTI